VKNLMLHLAVICLLIPASALAQDDFCFQQDFSPEEFAQRRAKVLKSIGSQAVALLQGASTSQGYSVFRQNNAFYYLCGIELPQAYLLLDGRSGQTTVYTRLPSRGRRSGQGAGDYVSSVKQQTGVDAVHRVDSLLGHLEDVPELYTLLGSRRARPSSQRKTAALDRGEAQALLRRDPLGQGRFVKLIQSSLPKLAIKNLSPIIDAMRAIKSPAEIALLRRAGKLSALAVMEAMRSTEVGMMEYQLDAIPKYIYRVNGARGEGYPSIIAGGANMQYGHYGRNNCVLKDGDIVLMDHAPDVGYYTSDIGRIWPVNGKYSAWQRELYGFIVKYHKAVLKRIRPGVTPDQIMQGARADMEAVLKATKFSKPIYEKAARKCYGHLSHAVGMDVHDVGGPRGLLKAGMVFAVDPQMRVPEEDLYIRIEDTVVVTEDGVDILTGMAPWEPDEVETLMQEQGMLQRYPPVFGAREKP
jgi:Xaa-Pro aminopeptidase